jgi:hypothetical protein
MSKYLAKRARGTHWIGGWVGPRTILDVVVKGKIPSPRRDSNPKTPIFQPVAQRYGEGLIWSTLYLLVNILFQFGVGIA